MRLVRPMAASRSPGCPFSAVQMGQAYLFRLLAAPCRQHALCPACLADTSQWYRLSSLATLQVQPCQHRLWHCSGSVIAALMVLRCGCLTGKARVKMW